MTDREKLEAEFRAQCVAVYREVREIRMHGFKINFAKLEGSFRASFAGRDCPDEFQFIFDPQGKLRVCLPMTDYAHTELITTVEMPEAAKRALQAAIESLFPGIKPYGRDGNTAITFQTPITRRVPTKNYIENLRQTVGRPGFEHWLRVG